MRNENIAVMNVTSKIGLGVMGVNQHNEMLYALSIKPAQSMLETGLISKGEFHQIKKFLIEKYQPILPSLLSI